MAARKPGGQKMSPGIRYITPKHAASDPLPLDPFHLSVAHSAGISSIQENMAEGSARLAEGSARMVRLAGRQPSVCISSGQYRIQTITEGFVTK